MANEGMFTNMPRQYQKDCLYSFGTDEKLVRRIFIQTKPAFFEKVRIVVALDGRI